MGTFLLRNATSIPRNPQDWRLGGNGWVVVGMLLNFFRIFNFGKVVRNQVVILFVIEVLAEKLGDEVFLFLGWSFCWRTFTVRRAPAAQHLTLFGYSLAIGMLRNGALLCLE